LTGAIVDSYEDFEEIAAPANPGANVARVYSRDDAGTTKLYYRRSDGTEIELVPGAVPPSDFTVWDADAHPLTPSIYDDEFDDSAFDAVLWTEFDPGGFLTLSENETGLIFDQATDPGDDIAGVYQAIPSGDFCITAKLSLTALNANYALIGLILFDDASNPAEDLYTWHLVYRAADQKLEVIRWTNYTTPGALLDGITDVALATDLYLRIRRISTTYYFDWSTDGIGWRQEYSDTLVFTPDDFGIFVNNVGQGITIRGIASFFRYTNSGAFNQILQGDRVDMWRA